MAKKLEVEIDVKTNAEGSIAQLKELKKQLKQTAAGSEEFNKLYNQIDDLEDKLKGSRKASEDLFDTLEGAGGPLGMLGKSLNSVKEATVSWGAALKATGIGLVVAAIGGLVAIEAIKASYEAIHKRMEAMRTLQKQLNDAIVSGDEKHLKSLGDLTGQEKIYQNALKKANEEFLPREAVALWNPNTRRMNFKTLNIGAIVTIRYNIEIQTFSNNTEAWIRTYIDGFDNYPTTYIGLLKYQPLSPAPQQSPLPPPQPPPQPPQPSPAQPPASPSRTVFLIRGLWPSARRARCPVTG